MRTFCTIVTSDHLPYAFAMFESIKEHCAGASMQIFVSDIKEVTQPADPDVTIYMFGSFAEINRARLIHNAYFQQRVDCFRWSMKPVFLQFLLEKGYDEVIYLDSDLYFFSDPNFLFRLLESSSVILTPHWRSRDPRADEKDFLRNFTHGIFNAGFVGVNRLALPALDWWGEACAYRCEKKKAVGLYDDQRYLDLLPTFTESFRAVSHRGCNIGNWNIRENVRSVVDGKVMINEEYPIVFIHFTSDTVEGILSGEDATLLPYLKVYSDHLQRFFPGIDIMKRRKKNWFRFS